MLNMSDKAKNITIIQYLAIIFLLLVGFLLIFGAHYQNNSLFPLPLHGDDWAHLGHAEYLMVEGKISNVNPYMQTVYHVNLEEGFASFLAVYFTITGLNPITTYQFLPAVFMIFTMFSLWYFMYKLTGKYSIAFLSAAFLLLLKSNTLTLGFWFLTPLTFSLFLIPVLFIFINSNPKNKLGAFLIFVAIMFAYPLAAVIVAGIFVLQLGYFLFDKKMHKTREIRLVENFVDKLKKNVFFYTASFLVFLALMFFILGGNIVNIPLTYKYSWTGYLSYIFYPWLLIGIIPFVLSVAGMIYVLKKKSFRGLLILPVMMLLEFLLFIFFRKTFLVAYPRAAFYLAISLLPLAAIGAYWLYEITSSLFKKIRFFKNSKYPKIISLFIILLILLSAFYINLSTYYSIPQREFSLKNYVTVPDYEALLWVRENYPRNTVMLINPYTVIAAYPIAHTESIAIADSNIGAGNTTRVENFFSRASSCEDKLNYLNEFKPRLVYSFSIIDCPFLNPVYTKNRYIYEFNATE